MTGERLLEIALRTLSCPQMGCHGAGTPSPPCFSAPTTGVKRLVATSRLAGSVAACLLLVHPHQQIDEIYFGRAAARHRGLRFDRRESEHHTRLTAKDSSAISHVKDDRLVQQVVLLRARCHTCCAHMSCVCGAQGSAPGLHIEPPC